MNDIVKLAVFCLPYLTAVYNINTVSSDKMDLSEFLYVVWVSKTAVVGNIMYSNVFSTFGFILKQFSLSEKDLLYDRNIKTTIVYN